MRRKLTHSKRLRSEALGFINHGIACNCLVLLKRVGLLDFLLNGNSIDVSTLSAESVPSQRTAICAALETLKHAGVLEKKFDRYNLTDFGNALCEYSGLITLLFEGHGSLMANQVSVSQQANEFAEMFLDGKSIAESSIQFGIETVDPLISDWFKRLRVKGTICDLGCGVGTRLSWICEETNCCGLGFENDDKAIGLANNTRPRDSQVLFEKADITNLDGIWEDVTVLMQYFVLHDIALSNQWLSVMNAYRTNFPHLQYFLYVDVVAPSEQNNAIMPGYDYVHGLLGIQTPTYEEMQNLFGDSDYNVIEEYEVPNLPNTYLWVLKPKPL